MVHAVQLARHHGLDVAGPLPVRALVEGDATVLRGGVWGAMVREDEKRCALLRALLAEHAAD